MQYLINRSAPEKAGHNATPGYDWMIMSTGTGYLPLLHSREKYVDHLEGFTTPELEESGGGRPQRTLIKTYMLETARYDQTVPDLDSLFPDAVELHRLDDTLYRVQDATHGHAVVGLLEALNDRHPVLYTTLGVDESNKWIRQVVDRSPLVGPPLAVVTHPVRAVEPRSEAHSVSPLCPTRL